MLIRNIELLDDILNNEYTISNTTDFFLNERGHVRKIEAPAIRDRVFQKSITKNILIPSLRPFIIYDNYASLKQRGTSFARKRFEVILRRYIIHHGTEGYIMLIDIKKYFENIDHDVLKKLVAPKIQNEQKEVIEIINYIIDTSSRTNKGLNLGGEPPQIFAVYYLNMIDTFVKIVKGIKYYGRYMDDIFVIAQTKTELKQILKEIEEKLSILKLEINRKKTNIIKLCHGFTFLQIKYFITDTGKIIKSPSHSKIVRERRRLKSFKKMYDNGKMTEFDIFNCYKSWRGTILREHNAYKGTIMRMDALYNRLFPEHESRNCTGRTEIYNEIIDTAYTEDLGQLFNLKIHEL